MGLKENKHPLVSIDKNPGWKTTRWITQSSLPCLLIGWVFNHRIRTIYYSVITNGISKLICAGTTANAIPE